MLNASGSPEHKAKVKAVLDDAERSQKMNELKGEALPLFKAWAERYNDGKAMSWKAVLQELTGVVLDEGVEMGQADYVALIGTFREKLGLEKGTNDGES